jgi:putative oxygen-independent coproporphyrinogen III oxidase
MLQRDLLHYREQVEGRQLESIFFGGGTPSLFSAKAIGKIIEAAADIVGLAADCEITLEANPGTFEQQRFNDYRHAGVNRLSIGVQSFSQSALQALGRIHSSVEAVQAFATARRAGFDNINLDLMFGLPGQDSVAALHDLGTAVELQPEHLSWYELTIEPNTAFYSRPPTLPHDDEIAAINDAGLEFLAGAGYGRYEVSAYANAEKQCRHNLNYWQFGDYLGIGAGAHGKLSRTDEESILRTQRNRMPTAYLNAPPESGFTERVVLTEEQPFEFLMNALRLVNGVPTSFFNQRTFVARKDAQAILKLLRDKGYITTDTASICPSDRGLRYLNQCLSELLPDNNRINSVAK